MPFPKIFVKFKHYCLGFVLGSSDPFPSDDNRFITSVSRKCVSLRVCNMIWYIEFLLKLLCSRLSLGNWRLYMQPKSCSSRWVVWSKHNENETQFRHWLLFSTLFCPQQKICYHLAKYDYLFPGGQTDSLRISAVHTNFTGQIMLPSFAVFYNFHF